MDKNKYIEQVYRKIKEQGIANAEKGDGYIDISVEGAVVFKVDHRGDMFYSSDNRISGIIDELHEKIRPIVCDVEEYLKAMENSTELKAIDFNMPYRKLAEFNGVIFAGTEHSDGSFEFATWDCRKNSLYHGHYYIDYRSAKQDFAIRSGLIAKQLVFNTDELVEIYRCLEDTKGNGYELSNEQEELIEKIQEKIKDSVVNFNDKLNESIEINDKRYQEQNQQKDMGIKM